MRLYPAGRMYKALLGKVLLLFIPVVLVLTVIIYTFYELDFRAKAQRTLKQEGFIVELSRQRAINDISNAVKSLRLLARAEILRKFSDDPSNPELRHAVTQHLYKFATTLKLFDQLRYLDETGREVTRINYRNNRVSITPEAELQDKSDRYYFLETRTLAPNSIYLSRLDLNIEHGLIELPPQPVLRFITPVIDTRGVRRGILVLNYLGSRLIDQISDMASLAQGDLMLIDEQGFWMHNETHPDWAWGGFLEHGKRFDQDFPKAWRTMHKAERGEFADSLGQYSYVTLHPLREAGMELGEDRISIVGQEGLQDNEMAWYLMSHLPADQILAERLEAMRKPAALFLFLALAWLIASIFIARHLLDKAQHQHRVKRLSSIIQQTNDIIFITNPKGTIEYANPSFERVTGYSSDEIIGKTPEILNSGNQDEAFYRRLWETILSGQTFQDVLANRTRSGGIYYEQKTITPLRNESGEITHFVSTGKDITDLIEARNRLYHLAFHHPLTDLPNRSLFRDRLEQAIHRAERHGHMVALLFLDLDRFKTINDSLGHQAGDTLLMQVGKRLLASVRSSDTVAHISGDEFAILLDEIHQTDEIRTIAEAILREFESVFHIDHTEVFVSVSLGIALYPIDDRNLDTLIKAADTAMYHAKELGRNRYEFYTRDMTHRAAARLRLETELRHALDRGEFIIHYQPIVDAGSGRVVSLEALLRWQHPQRGLLFPADFIAVLEESQLIGNITNWIVDQACRDQQLLQSLFADPVSVAINFSAHSFHHRDLIGPVLENLRNGCLDPRHLIVEVTETVLIGRTGIAEPILAELKKLGVRIALDDFGTGYSALSYLQRFPVDILKIDRRFIQNLPHDKDNAALATAIIAMGHNLNIQIVAEGVETNAQRDLICRRGADMIQGYLVSQPLPIDALEQWLMHYSAAKGPASPPPPGPGDEPPHAS